MTIRVDPPASGGWRAGLRVGLGLSVGAFALALSFGAFAVSSGWPAWLVIVMSIVVFSGGAQFAAVTAMTGGGGVVSALGAAALINTRFIPMAAASARSLRGGPWRRAMEGQTIVDGSWVAAQRPDGTLDRATMFTATAVQWPAWVGGTVVGALFAPSTEFFRDYGLDVIFPCFFLVLLLDSLRGKPRHALVAIVAVAIGVAAIWFVPGGVALLLCGIAAGIAGVRASGTGGAASAGGADSAGGAPGGGGAGSAPGDGSQQ
ncbi:AzlC family ABC transporter permease [Marisediminicola senii]|uniref:AzlC family ABC transporter permease n=1 Tax=Marisediminicola senii TaxID=2711233 RepID=UPI001913AC21|nr:AzlC family ABC transporter permease [Marisediminicola senii]